MIVIYWIQLAGLIVFTFLLLLYYAAPKVPIYAKALVYLSLLTSFVCFVILPIDIYQCSTQQQSQLESVKKSWKILYYINFVLCWFILPFAQQFQDSGEFTFSKKLKDTLVMNGILIGLLCIGAILIIVYILLVSSFTIEQLPGVFATLVNIFGLTLVTICLGFGLTSIPKQCFLKRDYKRFVDKCHSKAQSVKNKQDTIIEQMCAIKQIIEKQANRNQEEIHHISILLNQNCKIPQYIPHIDEQIKQNLSKKSNANIHKILKKRILQYNAASSQIDQLVDQLKSITESYLHNNYKYKKTFYTLMFILSIFASVLIFFAELATFAKFLAPANLLIYISQSGLVGLAINSIMVTYIAYLVTHTIFRIKVYNVFQLHRSHSAGSSLLFTSINLSRICYPLCYNYLQITNMPKSAFQQFIGSVNLNQQYTIIFPILMLLFAFLNAFDILQKIAGYFGLNNTFAFDDQQEQEKKSQGRALLIQRFKQRNIQNNHLQMIQLL